MSGVDHLVSVLPSLDKAGAAAQGLGFCVTDKGVHTGRGTANRLIMLPGCYWELLEIEEPTESNALIRSTLARAGLHGCALRIEGEAEPGPFARDIRLEAPVKHSRRIGNEIDAPEAIFRTIRTRTDRLFDGYFFFCEHLTPELVWRDELMNHPNGVTGLVGVDVVSSDVGAAAAFLAGMVGASGLRTHRNGVSLGVGDFDFSIVTPAGYANRFPDAPVAVSANGLGAFVALRFSVASLSHAAARVAACPGVTVRHGEGRLSARHSDLGETLIHFVGA